MRVGTNVFAPLGLSIFLISVTACSSKPSQEIEPLSYSQATQADPIPEDMFGIPMQNLQARAFQVEQGQSFSEILESHKVPGNVSGALIQASDSIFDLRKLRAGKPYTLLCKKGEDGLPVCLVYEASPSEAIIFDWRQETSPHVYREAREIVYEQKEAAGVIESSLYQTVVDQGLDPNICFKLDGMFKWSVDFFALQKGDRFRVIYEAMYADTIDLGVHKILAATFTHKGKEHLAIRFEQGEKVGFYDAKGQSMKSRFLKAPLEYSRISSRYNLNRYHPILKRRKPHLGTDYAAPTGTPIVSVADGLVIAAGYGKGNGNYVKVKHDNTYTTQYLHMSRFGTGIKRGVQVSQGQVIGYVGSTGLATGPHLCYRFWKNGKQVDPFKEQPQVTEPLADSLRPSFEKIRDQLIPRLESISYHEHLRQAALNALKKSASNLREDA